MTSQFFNKKTCLYALAAAIIVTGGLWLGYQFYTAHYVSLPVKEVTITTPASTLKISLPVSLREDKDFTLPKNIQSFVKNTTPLFGEIPDLVIRIYCITYHSEQFLPTWRPNLEDMANRTIAGMKNEKDFKNLVQEKVYHNISSGSAIEVHSRYMKGDTALTQRVFHLYDTYSTWTVSAVYPTGDNTMGNTVDDIFSSIIVVKK